MTREEKQKAIDALKISAPVIAVTQEEFNDYIQILNKIMDWIEQEPKTGHWILTSDDDYEYCTCSECGYQNGENWMIGSQIEYCSHCGAKMQEVEE